MFCKANGYTTERRVSLGLHFIHETLKLAETCLKVILAVQVEGVIHFENDIEELQQWDHQVNIAFSLIFFLPAVHAL